MHTKLKGSDLISRGQQACILAKIIYPGSVPRLESLYLIGMLMLGKLFAAKSRKQ